MKSEQKKNMKKCVLTYGPLFVTTILIIKTRVNEIVARKKGMDQALRETNKKIEC